jgi:hypothetical protein
MILPIILFYFINLVASFELNIENPKITIFKTHKSNKFLINNIYYRESINSRFILPLNLGIYNLSNSEYELYDGELKYGKPYNKNILLKPNISTEISRVYSYNIEEQYIYVFANIAQLSKKNLNFIISHNGKHIYNYMGRYLDYLRIIKAEPGLNIITLIVISNEYYCICPTLDEGYTHNYQLAIWNKTSINNNISSSVLNNNVIDNIIVSLNNSNYMNYFEGFIK